MPDKQYSGNRYQVPVQLRTYAPRQTEGHYSQRRHPIQVDDGIDDNPDAWKTPKPHTSAVAYTTPKGNRVIQRGNQRIVVHDDPPPRRRPHWLLLCGIGMMMMLLLWVGLAVLTNWWTQHQLDTTYEYPRISQADAVVYPGDTTQHPSHYLFLNLNGTVTIIELPHGDAAHARAYKGPTLFDNNAD